MKIPFTLDAWLKDKSQKVETRDGRPVKIISFEMTDTNDCPIAAQFRLCAGTPVVYLFDKEGHYKGEGDSDYDLFIVTPEPELTEFEEELSDIVEYCKKNGDKVADGYAKRHAAALISIAKQQLLQSGELMTQEHHEKLMETLREECKKDLPRWRRAMAGTKLPCASVIRPKGDDQRFGVVAVFDSEYITINDLNRLPKEEDNE